MSKLNRKPRSIYIQDQQLDEILRMLKYHKDMKTGLKSHENTERIEAEIKALEDLLEQKETKEDKDLERRTKRVLEISKLLL